MALDYESGQVIGENFLVLTILYFRSPGPNRLFNLLGWHVIMVKLFHGITINSESEKLQIDIMELVTPHAKA